MALLVAAMALYAGGWSLGRDEPTRSGGLETAVDPVHEWRQAVEGGKLQLEWSADGGRLLVAEVGAQGLRAHLLGTDLADMGALTAPELVWTPNGASWSTSGRWVLVWGTASGSVDVLLAWNTTTRDGTGSPLPDSSELGLPRIDAAALLANDRILAVAGRDQNGTSRVRMYELTPFRLHRDHAYPWNRTVLEMRAVVGDLVCLDSHGSAVIYESREWTQDWYGQVIQATPTAWCIDVAFTSLVGDAEGRIRYFQEHQRYVAFNATADGPVGAATFTFDDLGTHLLAVGGPSGPSELQVWHMDGAGKGRPFTDMSFAVNGTVTWATGHPSRPGSAEVALSNGTVRSYQVEVTFTPIPDTGPRYPWLWLLWFPFGALVLAAAVIWWRDRRAAAAARPEPERLRPRLSHRR